MTIIIGLGNPGKKFEGTKHNVGFMAIDFFAEKNNFPEFELSKKYNSLISEKGNTLLAKPQTFMNRSGIAVKKLTMNHKPMTNNLVVVHDDIDLPLGKIKIVKNRGAAGHKGVESVIKSVGNKDLVRFRIGIKPPKGKPRNPESFVIKKFTEEEAKIIRLAVERTAEALDFFAENGIEKTMTKYNG